MLKSASKTNTTNVNAPEIVVAVPIPKETPKSPTKASKPQQSKPVASQPAISVTPIKKETTMNTQHTSTPIVAQPLEWHTLGENLEYAVEASGEILMRFDPKKRLRLSASGKSMLVSTTGGNTTIPGVGVVCGVNIYIKV